MHIWGSNLGVTTLNMLRLDSDLIPNIVEETVSPLSSPMFFQYYKYQAFICDRRHLFVPKIVIKAEIGIKAFKMMNDLNSGRNLLLNA